MPTVGSFHTQYWENSSTQTTTPQNKGYPTWQSAPISLVLGMGLGGAEPFYECGMAALKWAFALVWIVMRWDRPRRKALEKAIHVMNDPLYPHALRAVKMTAQEPGFSGPNAWKGLAHKIHARHHWAENQWRHLQACDHFETMIRADGSTVTNPDRAVMVELAYQSFGLQATGSTKT